MAEKDDKYDWTSVDHTVEPDDFVDYLDTANSIQHFQSYKRKTYASMRAGQGHCVLDVGCGPGDDVLALSEIVGNTGRVIGIDNSETMIAEARKRAEGFGGRVEFCLGDAHDLDFADDTFDGCRADRVFQHLEDPKRALSEMIRVARSGARIVVSEPDWETFVIDMPNKSLTRKILNYFCDDTQNGWCGRELFRLFREAGLLHISVASGTLILTDYATADRLFSLKSTAEKMQNDGQLTETETAEWADYLTSASEAKHFFCAVTGFRVTGCKT